MNVACKLARKAGLLVLCLLALASCQRKPLYLTDPGNVQVIAQLHAVDINVLWTATWQTELQYELENSAYGRSLTLEDLGYSEPEWVRVQSFLLNEPGHDVRENLDQEVTFRVADTRSMSLKEGRSYDMLFYNAGTEYIHYSFGPQWSTYTATTRQTSTLSYNVADKVMNFVEQVPEDAGMTISAPETKSTVKMPLHNMPDPLFNCLLDEVYISTNPDDYEIYVDENGDEVYVLRISASLRPASFIYLVQVIVTNNYDDKGKQRIRGCANTILSGVSTSMDMFSRVTSTNVCAVSNEETWPMQTKRQLVLHDGREVTGDIFGSRLLTWGLPGINPFNCSEQDIAVQPEQPCHALLSLIRSDGSTYTIIRDVTDQMAARPTGGVITIEIDAGEDIPAPGPSSGGGGGGFNATVEDWGDEVNVDLVI